MKKVNTKNSMVKHKKVIKTEQEIQKEVDEKVLELFSRCTSKNGLTEDSVGCILALETEMEIYKGLRDALLAGNMEAKFYGSASEPNDFLDVDKFKFSLTKQGKKYVESGFKK